jgi:hypothetical protein
MFIFKVNVQSVHLETKYSQVKLSHGKNVTVDVSSGSKCHGGRNVSGRNVKAPTVLSWLFCPSCPISNCAVLFFCPGCPVLSLLSWLPCLGCPARLSFFFLADRSRLSCPSCFVPAVLSLLSCPCGPVLAVMFRPFCPICSGSGRVNFIHRTKDPCPYHNVTDS